MICHEKTAFCICENKDADQFRGNCEADQRFCFRYLDSTLPLANFCDCTVRFVWDLVRNPEDRDSGIAVHFICEQYLSPKKYHLQVLWLTETNWIDC